MSGGDLNEQLENVPMGLHQQIRPLVRAFHSLPILALLEKLGGLKAMQSP